MIELDALLPKLLEGDESAFEELVRETMPRSLATARRLLGNDEDAADAVQDAYVSAFKHLKDFKGGSRVSTWLHRIVINAALMKLRSRRRRPERSIEDFLPRFTDDGHNSKRPREWNQDALASIEREEMRRFVRASIEELPEAYREVLMLRDVEGLDTAETATVIGASENAVKTRLHRARQALRELVDTKFSESASESNTRGGAA